jgi:hypothetical protein
MALLALGVLWLTRVPSGAAYLTDLLPAFVVVGIAIGLTGPSVQIGALQGVAGSAVGLASGLVETMRELGGAVGIAVVSTVLVARTRDAIQILGPAAPEAAALEGFQSAFTVIVVVAAVAALVAAAAFPRVARRMRTGAGEEPEPVPGPGVASEVAHDRAGAKPALDLSSGAVEVRSDGRA